MTYINCQGIAILHTIAQTLMEYVKSFLFDLEIKTFSKVFENKICFFEVVDARYSKISPNFSLTYIKFQNIAILHIIASILKDDVKSFCIHFKKSKDSIKPLKIKSTSSKSFILKSTSSKSLMYSVF